MRVLVTGGAGFIGSHLVEALLHRGDTVRVLDNFSTGRRENLAPWKSDLEVIAGDLRDADQVLQAVREMDWVFHLAAFVSVPQSLLDPGLCFSVNVLGTANLLEASRKAGISKVVLSSSTAVYGDTEVFPTTEETPLCPLSPYALSKQVNELYAKMYTRTFDLPVIALRYFNVYGPRQRPDSPYAAAIPIFIHLLVSGQPITIFGNGKQSRDFIFVKDVVRANLLAAGSDADGEVYNICSGYETSILDLLEQLSEVSPRQPEVRYLEPRPGDIFRSLGSPGKAEQEIKFKAGTSLHDGLVETLDWMEGEFHPSNSPSEQP